MSDFDLQIVIDDVNAEMICGHVADDGAASDWIHAGAQVQVCINPPGTTSGRTGVIGFGRVHEDRVEIDLILSPVATEGLFARLTAAGKPRLALSTLVSSEYGFRVMAWEAGVAAQNADAAGHAQAA